MTTKTTPAVSYVRMSSGLQEASPAQQRAEIAKLAAKLGYRVIREYFDPGISGDDTEKRKQFQRMVKDSEEKGDFCAILCWDQDRFGRFDSIEAGRWIYPLRKAGVWLATVAQGVIDWNDFAGRMMYSIQQEGKHQFLLDLSRNSLRGRIASAKRGTMVVSPAYGYDRLFSNEAGKAVRRVPYGQKFNKPKGWSVKLVPSKDAHQVQTVRWLFDTYGRTDCSRRALLLDLNRRRVPPPRGKAWNASTLEYILANRVYLGNQTWGRSQHGKYHRVGADGDLTKATDGKGFRLPPIVVEGAHEALIDQRTFDRVQAKIAQRKGRNIKPKQHGTLLSGVIFCGHCGGTMTGKTRYYYCHGGQNGTCRTYHIRRDALDEFVLDKLGEILTSPRITATIEKAIHRRAKAGEVFQANAAALQGQIAALDKKITKGTENLLLADKADVADMTRLLAAWREDRAKLQEDLEELAANPDSRTTVERARAAIKELAHLRQCLKSADLMRQRAVIRSMVEGVQLWFEPGRGRHRKLSRGILTLRSTIEFMTSNNGRTGPHATTYEA